jgi:hypothetical protein
MTKSFNAIILFFFLGELLHSTVYLLPLRSKRLASFYLPEFTLADTVVDEQFLDLEAGAARKFYVLTGISQSSNILNRFL